MKEEERKELVEYRFSKAKKTLEEVDLHIENELWNTAVNRLYYACYYAVSALLLKNKSTNSCRCKTDVWKPLHKTRGYFKRFGKVLF